jgi:hypothetical protein
MCSPRSSQQLRLTLYCQRLPGPRRKTYLRPYNALRRYTRFKDRRAGSRKVIIETMNVGGRGQTTQLAQAVGLAVDSFLDGIEPVQTTPSSGQQPSFGAFDPS